MSDTTSITLLGRVRQSGDQQAWGRFVRIYAPLIFEWGKRAGLSEADAADLSQDVLIKLLEELPKFEYAPSRGRFRGWLRTVTRNECRRRQRRRNSIAAIGGDDNHLSQVIDTNLDSIFDDRTDPQLVAAQALRLMKSEFPTSTWQAAWKQIVEDQKPADVAAELGLSLASVYQARSRVLRLLREQLCDVIE